MEVADPRVIGDPRGVPIKAVAEVARRADADAALLGVAVRDPDAEPWAAVNTAGTCPRRSTRCD